MEVPLKRILTAFNEEASLKELVRGSNSCKNFFFSSLTLSFVELPELFRNNTKMRRRGGFQTCQKLYFSIPSVSFLFLHPVLPPTALS